MADDQKLTFKSEEERDNALAELPDEPPKGANIEEWQREQELKEEEIRNAPISEETASEVTPKEPTEEPTVTQKEEKQPVEPVESEVDYIDFTQLGKVKRSELDESVRNYKSAPEILKQAAHARRYANNAEQKLHAYEERIAELENTAKTVPELQKELQELRAASKEVKSTIESKPMSTKKRSELSSRLDTINEQISKLNNYEGDEFEPLQKAISSTVGALEETLGELDSVKTEFNNYRKDAESRYKNLENSIKSVSETTQQAEARRKAKQETDDALKGLTELQRNHPELKTSKPLAYADNDDDVEAAIYRMTARIYGRKPQGFDEVNRVVSAYNTKDGELMRICEQEGINPADFGINDTDIRNYGILMNVYWNQRGETIDPRSGKRVPVTDFRGKQITFPDFEASFKNMKDSGGLTQLENEMKIIEAEKKGQQSLNESLNRRDTSAPTLSPTGAPPEGQDMSEDQALEILGEKPGRMTVDEEIMERLLRNGDKRGWDMFKALQKACETLGLPVPDVEDHWKQVA